jgi:hypothetical protein
MTLAPSANSNVELLTGELKQFNDEDELYSFLDQLSHDVDGVSFLDKAKAAVNAWWARAVIGIANADKFYGYNTETSGSDFGNNIAAPERLKQWYKTVGLDDSNKVKRARSAARVWLQLNTPKCQDLIDEVGFTKLHIIGAAPKAHRSELVEKAQNVTKRELEKLVVEINHSPETLRHKLKVAEEVLAERQKKFDSFPAGSRSKANADYKRAAEDLHSAKQSVDRLKKAVRVAEVPGDLPSPQKPGAVALEAELKALKENTPKQAVKEVVKTVVDTSAQDEIKAQYEALLKQNAQLSAEMQKLQEAKDNWEKMCRAADKKVERMSGATREWENWGWERRMDLINVYITRFAESAGMFNFCQGDVDDSARRALVSPEARFKSHEERAIQAISMWIDVLSTKGVQELRNALENRGDLPPIDYVDSRELVTIDV